MTPEKVAVLVITGVIAVLLSITLLGSSSRGEEKSLPAVESAAEPAENPAQPRPQSEADDFDFGAAARGRYRTVARPDPKPEPAVEATAPGKARTAGGGTYRIRPRDTLEKIARTIYGRRSAVELILAENRGLEPRKLRSGMEIRLPALRDPDGMVAGGVGNETKQPPPRTVEKARSKGERSLRRQAAVGGRQGPAVMRSSAGRGR